MTQTPEEILTTIGYHAFVKSLYNRTGDMSKDFSHAVLGIVTETHEYLNATDKVNAIEEAGDLAFYATALHQVLNDFSPIDEDELDRLEDEILAKLQLDEEVNITEMHVEWLDLAKRWIGYGKAPTMSTTRLMAEATAMLNITMPIGILETDDAKEVLIANVRKLMKRYNGIKFDADLAVNRDTAAEREQLELSLEP